MRFPIRRMRRLRRTPALRAMVAETRLHPADFVYPLFISESVTAREEIDSLPGVFRHTPKTAAAEARRVFNLGLPAILLFGIPAAKDATGSASLLKDGIVQRGIAEIKSHTPDIVVITDVCLCEYTDHGHCGVIVDGAVDNDATLDILARQALSHAEAGANIVAPSDMMDGRVQAIRLALDANGFSDVAVMSYAAKYASAFYGPFREAVDSAPQFGDRKGYQMDPRNTREALEEIRLDIEEGADIVMVKPALAYLDVIRRARARFDLPLAAYNVSGEYAMVKAAVRDGATEERPLVFEILTAIKRAGADIIVSYHAPDVAGWLAE